MINIAILLSLILSCPGLLSLSWQLQLHWFDNLIHIYDERADYLSYMCFQPYHFKKRANWVMMFCTRFRWKSEKKIWSKKKNYTSNVSFFYYFALEHRWPLLKTYTNKVYVGITKTTMLLQEFPWIKWERLIFVPHFLDILQYTLYLALNGSFKVLYPQFSGYVQLPFLWEQGTVYIFQLRYLWT